MSLSLPGVRRFQALWSTLLHLPWRTTVHTLRLRFREDQLGMTASSLTFTTILALVPFVTVALAVFTAFPIFGKLQEVLQSWLIESLVPDSIARQVLGYITQFSAKASRLGGVGFSFLVVTALALILTIDRTLNKIWRVRRLRPLGQRVLIYWAALTLGPLLLSASLVLTSYVASASGGLVQALPRSLRLLFDSIEFVVLALGVAAMYRYVPHTVVRWKHAGVGGLLVALCMELAKKLLGMYLLKVPTYSMVYGTFATLPILLVWIYMAWVLVLAGAVVTAYLPSLLQGVARRGALPGWSFQLAVEVLQALHRVRRQPGKGLAAGPLAQALCVEVQQLAPVLETLTALDWIGAVSPPATEAAEAEARYLLLVDPQDTPLEPLLQRLLLEPSESLQPLWQRAGLSGLCLADVLPKEELSGHAL
ncbi:MAG: YihY family inner membrane protein [Burkholderiaceae bacterium]|nr:YihY family inner membrane protein [Burkholderiaceae bacterium]